MNFIKSLVAKIVAFVKREGSGVAMAFAVIALVFYVIRNGGPLLDKLGSAVGIDGLGEKVKGAYRVS